MQLRSATAADAALLSNLHAESWRAAYVGMVPQPYLDELSDDHWTATFQGWLAGGKVHALVAEQAGRAVGCALYGANPGAAFASYLPDWGEIISLYVHPNFFRKGCGTALLLAAREALRAEGRPGCYLWALRENTRARRFYEALGFRLTSDTTDVPLGGAVLTDFRYCFAF